MEIPRALHGPSALRRQALGILLLAGGLLAALTAALPPDASGSEALVIACGAVACSAGGLLLLARRQVPEVVIGGLVALGTALVAVATLEGGTGTGTEDNEMLFVWVCLFSFFFLSLRHALLQLAFVATAYAVVLSATGVPTQAAATQWFVTMTTLTVAGLLVAHLRDWLERLVSELSDKARIDSLTGLLNRAAFKDRATIEFARARRSGSRLALILADLDGFKTINDNLGHLAGDQVLRQVGEVLEHETRPADAVARIGGDEFAVLLADADAATADEVAERLRVATRRSAGEMRLRLSLSAGVAVAAAAQTTLSDLWSAADAAMYEAKRSGRDAVVAAEIEAAGVAGPTS